MSAARSVPGANRSFYARAVGAVWNRNGCSSEQGESYLPLSKFHNLRSALLVIQIFFSNLKRKQLRARLVEQLAGLDLDRFCKAAQR